MHSNPINIVEKVIEAYGWQFDRYNVQEIAAQIRGQWCQYKMHFVWDQELEALIFSSFSDLCIPDYKYPEVIELVSIINHKLWLGHFALNKDLLVPVFRHTILLKGVKNMGVELCQDLIDTALIEWERFYPALQYVLWSDQKPYDAYTMAAFDVVGSA
ncbi:MAG: YbjN domain-containing protein [Alphaproteobacteria bacterium]|nr:YbjN domain-containing protein [Alphaproteobacteria bacterium]